MITRTPVPWVALSTVVLAVAVFVFLNSQGIRTLLWAFVPESFHWGLFKPRGRIVFLITLVLYPACVLLSVLVLRRIVKQLGSSSTAFYLSLVALIPALITGVESLVCQVTSAHQQSEIHRRAVITAAVSVVTILVAGTIVDLCFLAGFWRTRLRRKHGE